MTDRRPALYGAALCALFIVYGSLYPFGWSARPDLGWLQALGQILLTAPSEVSRVDFGTNVLLTLPLAFCLMAWLRPRPGLAAALRGLAVLLFCLALAVTVELLQSQVPGRVPSRNDIFAQGLGALIGLALWFWRGEPLWTLISDWSPFRPQLDRRHQLAQLYLIAVYAYGLLPLDLTLSPGDLWEKWKLGLIHMLPFHQLARFDAALLYQYASILLIWGVAAWLLQRAYKLPPLETAGRTLLAAAVLELLQLLVFSRSTDSTDVLLATTAGLVVGWAGRAHATPGANPSSEAPPHLGRITLLALGMSMLSLTLAWYPFQAHSDPQAWHAGLQQWLSAPLGAYFENDLLGAATAALRKALLFAPWGVLAAWLTPRGQRGANLPAALLLLCALVLMLLIELGKLFLHDKVSSPSNIAIEALAAWLAFRWTQQLRLHGRTPDTAATPLTSAATLQTPWSPRWLWLVLPQALLTMAALTLLSHVDGLPYNFRALIAQRSFLQLLGFVLAISLCVLPWACWARWPRPRPRRAGLLLWLLQPLLLYTLLRVSVPEKQLFDITGFPQLGWPPELEAALRFVGLNLLLAWGVQSAHRWLDGPALARRSVSGGINWLIGTVLLAALWHWVVVSQAITDNLVELMRDGGGLQSTTCLFAWMLLLYGSAWVLVQIVLGLRPLRQLVGVLVAGLLCYGLLDLAFEPVFIKYEHAISAWQSLLSQNRQHYADPSQIPLRYAAAHTAALLALGWSLLPMLLPRRRASVP